MPESLHMDAAAPKPPAAAALPPAVTALLDDALLLDLEVHPDGRLLEIGAVLGEASFHRAGRIDVRAACAQLGAFAQGARYVLGHNLLDHDLPVLRGLAPDCPVLRLPALDTLYLSPLAFPENPYHALVKDYKLVGASRNDPLADARLAGQVLREQCQALAGQAAGDPDWIDLLHWLYRDARPGADGVAPDGFLALWRALGAQPGADGKALLRRQVEGRVCASGWADALTPLLNEPRERHLIGWLMAWLRVAGGNSVLPPWLRRTFPVVPATITALRETPCTDPGCTWCRDAHDPQRQLRRWFGYPAFRAEPATADGASLQAAIVGHGLGGGSLLGILPTGGGKSLCFQVPALTRYRNRGALTLVISPLRALMKDQVDGLNRRVGLDVAGALYGDLTLPERSALRERVRLGDIALLYVAPEQFRNPGFAPLLAQREIAAWVFDEAHCLSKWGHDFRTDYLYCATFIREWTQRQGGGPGRTPAPVHALTATAKPEVIAEIREHLRRELGLELALYAGGVERDNLRFEVQELSPPEKYGRLHGLLRERLGTGEGAAVVYCASRKGSEETAQFLAGQSWSAAAFHAGLPAPDKRMIQDDFLNGVLRVICATNAFGMGIDKDNVRLVVHADVPGSLENYLQEAGRAGRDRAPADCVLLYTADDIERQFRMGAQDRLAQRDIAGILRVLRRLQGRRGEEPVVVTSGELLRDESLEIGFTAGDRSADTRVRTAIAWLERSGYVRRDDNHIGSYAGRPRVRSLAEARERMAALDLPVRERLRWEAVLEALWAADPDGGLSTDVLALLPELQPVEGEPRVEVLRVLDAMEQARLLESGLQFSAWLRPRSAGSAPGAKRRLEALATIERALLEQLDTAAPDTSPEDWLPLELRLLNQRLLDAGHQDSDPELLRKLLKGLAQDGLGLARRQKASLMLRAAGQGRLYVRVQRRWTDIRTIAGIRQGLAGVILDVLLARVPAGASGEVLVAFALEDLRAAVGTDLLGCQLKDPLAAIERALLHLHEQGVIVLQQGLGVFRNAMSIRVLPEAKGRRYNAGDYAPLGEHYRERVLQVHVMAEYARLALAGMHRALEFVRHYFTLERSAFLRRYFAGREEELKIQTSPATFRAIVDALGNPEQQAIVAAAGERNLLVLAGPGSGKTRVVVHRIAWLLRVQRVPARAMLVLCYNRSAALELRRRLAALVGPEARGVTVQTFHGLALALTGHAFDGRAREAIDFEALIRDATALLRGERELIGASGDELRERLLAGYRHILVDEYQDIDSAQYELVAALAGRTLDDPDRKLAILAVGDDDQNIYAFRDTDVGFIRRYGDDYAADTHRLVENHRSSGHIVDAANRLIAHNTGRMKAGFPGRVDRARRDAPAGGVWAVRDPLAQGRVQVLHVADRYAQAACLVAELQRLRTLDPTLAWSDCAVLARTHEELCPVRAALEALAVPVARGRERDGLPSPWAVREIAALCDELRGQGFASVDPRARAAQLPPALPWTAGLRRLFEGLALESGATGLTGSDDDGAHAAADAGVPAACVLDALVQWLEDARQGLHGGEGVYLDTAHSAKGQEFRAVAVLGDWRPRGTDSDPEAERRLYYVAMTRAREILLLCARTDTPAPMLALLDGDSRFDRRDPPLAALTGQVLRRRYELLGLEDVYLSYAARQPAGAPIHRALAAAQPGDALRLVADGEHLYLLDAAGDCLARLSQAGTGRWRERLDRVLRVTLLALVVRRREDEDAAYRDRSKRESWLVPVAEVMLDGMNRPGNREDPLG